MKRVEKKISFRWNQGAKKNSLFLVIIIFHFTNCFAQNYEWAFRIGSSISSDNGWAIVTDASGNVYVSGYFQGTVDFDPGPGMANRSSAGGRDLFIAKYNAASVYQWAFRLGSTGEDYGMDIDVDGAGNVYITGVFQGVVDFNPGAATNNLVSAGTNEIFMAKYTPAGAYQWAYRLGSPGSDYGVDIAADNPGNVYVTGSFRNTVDFDPGAGTANLISAGSSDIYVAKYNTAGAFQWAFNCGNTIVDEGRSIDVDGSGNVYVTGYFQDTCDFDPSYGAANLISAGLEDMFVAKYSPAGTYLWAFSIGDSNLDLGHDIAVDGAGNVHVTGRFRDTADFDPGAGTATLISTSVGIEDIFVAQYSPAGIYQWAFNIGSTGIDIGEAIAVDGPGNVYITGQFNNIADFDPGAGIVNLSSTGLEDIFVAKYSSSGAYQWAFNAGNTNQDVGVDIAVGLCGVYATGGFQNTADFNPGAGTANFTSAGSLDIFVARYNNPSLTVNITGNTTVCSGNSITLSAPGGGSYLWNTGVTTAAINIWPTSSTTYSVIVSDGNCSDTASVFVTVEPLPVANAGPDISMCSGSSATINAGGNGSFLWSPSTGLSNATIANPVASVTSTTTYTLSVTNNCGTAIDTMTIIIPPLPSANAGANTTICPGSNTTLQGSGAGTFIWSPATGLSCTTCPNPVASPTATTTYTLSVTDACGSSIDSVKITMDNPVAFITGTTTICSGSSTILTASGGITYLWNTGDTTSNITITPTTATSYSVLVNNGSCTNTAWCTVNVHQLPAADAGGTNILITQGQSTTLTATGGISYHWTPATGLNDPNISNPVASPLITTQYCVTVSDTNGCTAMSCVTVTVEPIDCSSELYLPNAFSPNNDGENDFLQIYHTNLNCIHTLTLVIYDRWGENVFETDDPNFTWEGNYRGNPDSPDSYRDREQNTAVFVYKLKATTIYNREINKNGNITLVR